MGVGFLYFFVIVIANSLGAISGMGGGVIIKPILDLINIHNVVEVSFYSTVAVFTMSVISTMKQFQRGFKIDSKKILFIALGSILGGIFGNLVFDKTVNFLGNDVTKLTQIVVTVIVLIFAYAYSRHPFKNFNYKSLFSFILCGLILGFLASFLGIGGGPINVTLLMLMFSMPIKDATVYSIGIIFFSQLSKIVSICLSSSIYKYDLSILIFIIPAAVIGGLMGSHLSNVSSSNGVKMVFEYMILFIIFINVYNGIQIVV